jgi:hypothetical protein
LRSPLGYDPLQHNLDYEVLDWSIYSKSWTDELRTEVGEDLKNDGTFFVSFEDFIVYFFEMTITQNTEGWYRSHFLMLDDTTAVRGIQDLCGNDCTRHVMTLTSAVDQTVVVSAQTWEDRCNTGSCNKIGNDDGK